MIKIKKPIGKRILYIITPFTALLLAVLITVNVTMAWIENNVNPVFQASQLELKTSPGLVMTIDGTQTDIIDLNDYLTDLNNKPFVLTEMTSYDGELMYVRINNSETDDVKLSLASDSDKNVSYIDFTIHLTAIGADDGNGGKNPVNIYLGKIGDSTMTYLTKATGAAANADKPIRLYLSYSYTDPVTNTVVSGENIFSIDNTYQTKAVETIDNNTHLIDPNGYHLQDVDLISDYFYNPNSPNSNIWFSLPDSANATIRLKIWLEGCDGNWVNNAITDGNCVDTISGSQLQMKLTFFTPQITANP